MFPTFYMIPIMYNILQYQMDELRAALAKPSGKSKNELSFQIWTNILNC